ncbi:MAG TPA: efflux RND transporter permease subunit [Thermoanaerobaculia bacterium]
MNGLIAWFARNGVAANFLMLIVVVAGLVTLTNIRQEVFPEAASDIVSITIFYPGASPEEVEQSLVSRVEERIQDLEGVKRITSTASEGVASISVEALEGSDSQRLLDDVKSRVDAIDTFPVDAEKPVVTEFVLRRQVINIAVSGEADEETLKNLGERVRDEVSSIPGITQVELSAVRPYEIAIETSEESLRRHGLTFDAVAAAVRRSSLDLPAGSIKTEAGEVLIRTNAQAYLGRQFEDLVLLSRPDGSRVLLRDVAVVRDSFAETDQAARFDGKPAVLIQVFRVGEQDALEIAAAVKEYIEEARATMPQGIAMTLWQDDTLLLESRRDLLLRNGRMGLVLLFLVLALFLRFRLAGWVAIGIPISFLGALWLMPMFDISINLLSLFAFIIVLGIVVDDAIVIGENIHTHLEKGKPPLQAAIDGAQEVAVPVIFSILTSVAAFSPLLLVGGMTGRFMRAVPIIVIATLVFSLIESLFVLPSHLSHLKPERQNEGIRGAWTRLRRRFSSGLEWIITRSYVPSLRIALTWRYAVVAGAVSALLVTAAAVGSGWIKFTFFPPIDADNVVVFVTMPLGTPVEQTAEAMQRLERSAVEVRNEIERNGDKVFRHMLTSIGEQPFRTAQSQGHGGVGTTFAAPHLGELNIELASSEERNITSAEIANRWRELTGPIPDAVEVTFSSNLFSAGDAVNIQLTGNDLGELRRAAEALKGELTAFPGVLDISDSWRAGKEEVKVDVTPEGEAMGISRLDLARQVRQAFFGEEAQRIQRGRDDVRVMVRYPEAERRSLGNLEEMRIRTASGNEVPFSIAGTAEPGRGYASIRRVDRRRAINVTADVDPAKANAREVITSVRADVLPRVMKEFPGVRYTLEGEQREQQETLGGLGRGFIMALFLIYALLAIPFRSYLQPTIVMSAIPFGILGAIGGHILMRMDLTVLSFFGIIALTGVVVNDSLVMVDFINRAYRSGVPLRDAIVQAGSQRFRPILLTSLTTFFGLLPLILERSMQAQFLIPMAISLAFGVLFATFITLILVPVNYRILEDVYAFFARLRGREENADEMLAGGTSEG